MTNIKFKDYPEFTPNLTPEQIMKAGVFGGGYWRPIYSGITNKKYKNEWKEFPEKWFLGLTLDQYGSKNYNTSVNKYKVHSGARLNNDDTFGLLYWESKKWIVEQDPYGWVQWYFRFYLGRRSPDDERQIKRWQNFCGKNGRFRVRLIKNCIKFGKKYNDFSVSPIIRQGLLHWGYELTKKDFEEYKKLNK